MKSLEIVNEKMQQINTPTQYCAGININLFELEQIKQDLEVLEILKEQYDGEYSEEEMFGASCVEDKNRKWICLTISTDNEKYNKVKQWLEANE